MVVRLRLRLMPLPGLVLLLPGLMLTLLPRLVLVLLGP